MNIDFSNQIILVAGGTGGLGRAVSLAFLAAGASVIVTYRKAEEFEALKSAAGANAGRVEGEIVDVTDEAAVGELVEGIVSRWERVDAMVNTVGGFAGGKALWETEGKTLDQMMSLNVKAGFVLAKGVVPHMLKAGRGAIVNVASTAAVQHGAGLGAYAASKAAALAMIDSLAADLMDTNVRVNTVMPSIIDTELNRKMMPKADFSKWAKPEEIARVILFLCSDEAKLVRGAAIAV